MNPNTELVYAPFRSLDDFILSQSRLGDMTVPPENTKNLISRFQVPEYQNMDKFRNRVVSNLIYYQTNYAVLSLIFFTLVTYMNPLKMMLGILTITLCKLLVIFLFCLVHIYCAVFCLLYYCDASQEQVKQMKREHPTLVMMATFLTAYFFIYQVGSSTLHSNAMSEYLFTVCGRLR